MKANNGVDNGTNRYTIEIVLDVATDPRVWIANMEHEYFYFDKEKGEKLVSIKVIDGVDNEL